jgi:hypothetical protein
MMRTLCIVLALASAAHAGNRIVVLTDRDVMPAAVQGALADRHVEVMTQPPPDGALRLDRAASAQHVAMANGADVGVWIDADEVWVVSADGRLLRHARVPADATPGTFAQVTVSLLDEVFAPIAVDVHVDIQPPRSAPTTPAAVVVAPPAVPAVRALDLDAERATHTLVEIGPTASPATIGGEIEIAFPLGRNLRLGGFFGANQLHDGIADFEPGTQLYDGGLELRYVGEGKVHLEVGFAGGFVHGIVDKYTDDSGQTIDDTDTGGLTALRVGLARELSSGNFELAVEPMILFDLRGHDQIEAVMASLRWGLPL